MKSPLTQQDIILASSSPRRKELLETIGVFPRIVPSHFDEESVPFTGCPEEYVTTLARGKAEVIAQLHPDALVLSADTFVYASGKVLNKPKDYAEAREMLSLLSGISHSVYTGVALSKNGIIKTAVERTIVRFNPLTSEQIEYFIRSQNVFDKAGGYAIQGLGSLLVERIDGCYYNVVGLPLNLVHRLFTAFGYSLWDHLSSKE